MQYRKRKTGKSYGISVRKKPSNLIKGPPGSWAEWRSVKGPPAIFRKPQKGESGYHRLQRLVRDTPGCDVCGTTDGLMSQTRSGKTVYRCPDHIRANVNASREASAPKSVRRMKRINITDIHKEEK